MSRCWRLLVLVLFAACVAACDCGNGAAVARVESMSQAQLADVAARLVALESGGRQRLEGRRLPAGFEDLDPQSIWVAPGRTMVVLAGCFDDKSTLHLDLRADGRRQLSVSAGERAPMKVLWVAQASAP